MTRSSLRRVDDPAADGLHIPPCNRCRHWSDKGVFDWIFSGLSAPDAPEPSDAPEPGVLMIDATDPQAHPTVPSLNKGDLIPA